MPHITLQHSSNIKPSSNVTELLAKLHETLHIVGGIKLENCKSRRVIFEDYLVGDGEGNQGFVHLDIRFIEGRDEQTKRSIGAKCNTILQQAFLTSSDEDNIQITVEVRDILLADYHKYPEGTLTLQN